MRFKSIFPQANSLSLIFDLICSFDLNGFRSEDVASRLEMHDREGHYYLTALEFLTAVERQGDIFFLSSQGLKIRNEKNKKLQLLYFLFLFFSNPTMLEMYKKGDLYKEESEKFSFFVKYIEMNYGLLESTAKRRASTVLSWFRWIDNFYVGFNKNYEGLMNE
jgi:hypothetical protein